MIYLKLRYLSILGLSLILAANFISCKSKSRLPNKFVSNNELFLEMFEDSSYHLYNGLSKRESFSSTGTLSFFEGDSFVLIPNKFSKSLNVNKLDSRRLDYHETWIVLEVRTDLDREGLFKDKAWYDLYYSLDSLQWESFDLRKGKVKLQSVDANQIRFKIELKMGVIPGITNRMLFSDWLSFEPSTENVFEIAFKINQFLELNNLSIKGVFKGNHILIVSEVDSFFNRKMYVAPYSKK